jgi:hypothetical protein
MNEILCDFCIISSEILPRITSATVIEITERCGGHLGLDLNGELGPLPWNCGRMHANLQLGYQFTRERFKSEESDFTNTCSVTCNQYGSYIKLVAASNGFFTCNLN